MTQRDWSLTLQRKQMKPTIHNSRLAVIGAGYLVSLVAIFALVPLESTRYDLAAAMLMLVFGPYLLVVGCPTGFGLEPGTFLGLLAVLPFYVAHVAFISSLSKRFSLWRRLGCHGERARKIAVILWALISATGIWYEIPVVTRYDLVVDGGKIPMGGLRLAVVSDLHSCRYGVGQRALIKAVQKQNPDAVLLVGDIFDDHLPDNNAKLFLVAIAGDYPCFSVFGNHEHWSKRIPEIKDVLLDSGVTVLNGSVATIGIKNAKIDLCGIDDPTYMSDDTWLGQLASVAKATNPPHLKVLLSHRPEYAAEYEKHDFDLVFSGHLHGGQWHIPGLGLGVVCPSAGGPYSGERHLFPRHAGGAYWLKNKATMVVSRGLARESTPIPRFFNHPELVVVNLRPF